MPIEDIRVGDHVRARDENTGAVGWEPVAETFKHRATELVRVEVAYGGGGDAITLTRDHPAWIVGEGWTSAATLRPGDRMLGRDGEAVEVVAVVELSEEADVYNVEVEDLHTYFVGRAGVWAHNMCADGSGIKRGPGGARKHKPGKAHRNATTQRKDKERFAAKMAKKREEAQKKHEEAVKQWKDLLPEQRKLLRLPDPNTKK